MNRFLLLIIIFLFPLAAFSQNSNKEKAISLTQQAIKSINKKECAQAILLLDSAAKLDPTNGDIKYEKALALYLIDKFSEAILILDSLKSSPDAKEHHYQLLGNSYDSMKNPRKAIETYKEGLAKFPNSGRLCMELGLVEIAKNHNVAALNFFQKGIKVEPTFENNYYYIAKLNDELENYVWSAIYGELFLSLSTHQARIKEISKLVFNSYNKAFFYKLEGKSIVKFLRFEIVSESKRDYQKMNFDFCVQEIMRDIAPTIIKPGDTVLSINQMHQIRTKFNSLWYEKKLDARFPNILFDWQRKAINAKQFEQYNYMILNVGNPEEYKEWQSKNEDKVKPFIDWLNHNYLKINKDSFLVHTQYPQ